MIYAMRTIGSLGLGAMLLAAAGFLILYAMGDLLNAAQPPGGAVNPFTVPYRKARDRWFGRFVVLASAGFVLFLIAGCWGIWR